LDANPQVGAVEGCIVDTESRKATSTGTRELTLIRERIRSKRILRILFSRIYKSYIYADWDRHKDKEIEVACNAFMMVRTDILASIGGFNEAMKMYYTEEYLSDRIRELKYSIWHLGGSRVMHAWSSSTKKVKKSWIDALYQADKILYLNLKYGR
jgi:GT2 family glycosyltransferase